jgi:hypothetical protein
VDSATYVDSEPVPDTGDTLLDTLAGLAVGCVVVALIAWRYVTRHVFRGRS